MLLGFKPRFVDPILIGTKVHTMRVPRKLKPKIGETLYMYTGLRTRNCALITNKEKLIGVQRARIIIHRRIVAVALYDYNFSIEVDGKKLNEEEISRFVKFDGFKNREDFCAFWFAGKKEASTGGFMELYHWTDLKY